MASSPGSSAELPKAWRYLRESAKWMSWCGTAILGTTAVLAEQICSTVFPELEGSWSRSTATRASTSEDTSVHDALSEDRPYAVAENGFWIVAHEATLRKLMLRAVEGEDVEFLLADLEIETNLHGDDGDHPEFLPEELAEHLEIEE